MPEKERKIPSTFLSPPGGEIQLGDDNWREASDTEIETDIETSSVEITTSEATTAKHCIENIANTTVFVVFHFFRYLVNWMTSNRLSDVFLVAFWVPWAHFF